MPIPQERLTARATYTAPWLTVGDHQRLDVAVGGDFIEKVAASGVLPTHIKIQALTQNVRYRIDGSGQASATIGFQLVAGAETTLPVPNNGVSIFEEVAGAVVQYQWLR